MAFIGSSQAAISTSATSIAVASALTPPGGGTAVAPPAGTILLLGMQGGTQTSTLSPPSGFTAVPNCAQQVTGNVGVQGAWYKVATGSEPSSYTLSSTTSDKQTAFLLGFSGRNASSPFSSSAATPQEFGSSPFVLVCNPVSANAGDDVVIMGGNRFFDGTDAVTYTPPTGFGNNQCVYANAQYSPVAFWSIDQNVAAGSYGSAGGTITTNDTDSQGSTAFVIALAANPTQSTVTSFSGTGNFGFEGALEIIDSSTSSATGIFTFTGEAASASASSVYQSGGVLVGNPDYIVHLPYRPFTVVLM